MLANCFLDFSISSSILLGLNLLFCIETFNPFVFLSFSSGATSVSNVSLRLLEGSNFFNKDSNPSGSSGSHNGSIDSFFNASFQDFSIIFSNAEAYS